MDFNSLRDQVSNLSLYDVKAGIRKVQNAVMNFTEMEAKVREATNNEPWGASSSLMQEIANGTFNYQTLNEIMPMIYKRFTEKSAEEWRQIYKALQLLEFLIKHGSERVIDDARSHLSLLKMLRQFHFIDQNGKDQGINVRNRSKELAELLSDVERIRSERKKARATRSKYTGVEGGAGMGMSGSMSSGSRYGGFGSEEATYGAYGGQVYGDGGGFGGNQGGFSDTQRHGDKFEEYDEYDEGATASPASRATAAPLTVKRETKKEPPKPKQPEVDLFSFDEPAPSSVSNGKQPALPSAASDLAGGADEDDFDDFQSATPAAPAAAPASTSAFGSIAPPTSSIASPQIAAPQPKSGAQGANINDLFASISPAPSGTSTPQHALSAFSPPAQPTSAAAQLSQPKPAGYQPSGPNYFTSVPLGQTQSSTSTPSIMSPGSSLGAASKPSIGGGIGGGAGKKAGGDAFSDLLAGTSIKKSATPTQKVTMADMAKQKTSQGLWGAPAAPAAGAQPQQGQQQQKLGGGLDDLLG